MRHFLFCLASWLFAAAAVWAALAICDHINEPAKHNSTELLSNPDFERMYQESVSRHTTYPEESRR